MTTIEKPTQKKQAQLALWLSEDHKQRIEQAAAMTGQTLDSFAATELVRRADEILENQEVHRLSNRDRDIFLALLDADEEPNEALKAAAAEYKKGHRDGETYHFDMTNIDEQKATAKPLEAEPPRILSNRDRDIFLALLDADHEPTQAAREAAARFDKGYFVGRAYHFQTPTPDADGVPREN